MIFTQSASHRKLGYNPHFLFIIKVVLAQRVMFMQGIASLCLIVFTIEKLVDQSYNRSNQSSSSLPRLQQIEPLMFYLSLAECPFDYY